MALKQIDQDTIQPGGKRGLPGRTSFAIVNENTAEAEQRLSTLEGGSGGVSASIAALQAGLLEEAQTRAELDDVLGARIDAEQIARQDADGALAAIVGRLSGRNRIINGSHLIAQRATNKPVVDTGFNPQYHCVDRWYMASAGTMMAMSQQLFPAGQTAVPGNPATFLRVGSISNNSASALAYTGQTVEDVRTFSGTNSVLSFWAKASSTRKMGVSTVQYFGAGGSADTNQVWPVLNLTTEWQKFTVQIALPSCAGKIIGANNHVRLRLWIDVGSNYTNIAGVVGSQSGDFDIALVQWEDGDVPTAFEFEHPGDLLLRCYRYCYRYDQEAGNAFTLAMVLDASSAIAFLNFAVPMRTKPSARSVGALATITDIGGSKPVTGITLIPIGTNRIALTLASSGLTPAQSVYVGAPFGGAVSYIFDAEL
ncbi:hypothetical protein [Stenotrophomonas sp.]|uniref:hypothetical protein n=1 Tax=Stenotrophomonas sp. TaxID=69392 RepID=UPI00289753EB|nr:hypothetical protein [Stenotrophomonas sp.]